MFQRTTKPIFFYVLVFFILLWTSRNSYASNLHQICPGLWSKSQIDLQLSQVEKTLVCDSFGGKEWKNISPKQRLVFLRKILASRAYYFPNIEQDKEKRTVVDLGFPAKINEIRLENDHLEIGTSRFWQVHGDLLNSKNLDRIETWILEQYARHGFPCAELSTTAFPREGSVRIRISPKHQRTFARVIQDERNLTTDSALISRFNAFKEGELYEQDKVSLTSLRLENDNIILKSRFTPVCEGETAEINLRQKSFIGKGNLISVGFGFDSDDLFYLESAWRSREILSHASKWETELFIAKNRQSLRSDISWFYAPIVTRHHLKSSIEIEQEVIRGKTEQKLQIESGPVLDFDAKNHRFTFWIGPSFKKNGQMHRRHPMHHRLEFSLSLHLEDIEYELSKNSPKNGHEFNFKFSKSEEGFGSTYSASHYRTDFKKFFNLFMLDPAIWIIGVRGGLNYLDIASSDLAKIHRSNLLYIGGSNSVRGFPLRELPCGGARLTSHWGLELRINEVFPWSLAPILYFDQARVILDHKLCKAGVFSAIGLGMQWHSPLGVLRGSFAYGLSSPETDPINRKKGGLKFNLNLGDEF